MLKPISGIYNIVNKINGKQYVGSSNNIEARFIKHKKELKGGYHRNKHLQSAIIKYGIENFQFNIIEECENYQLLKKEQSYIDKHDWLSLYNLTRIANSGGGDLTAKPLLLIDLKGNIIERFNSGLALANYLGRKRISYKNINTPAISKKQYRVVSPEFYASNKNDILCWKDYSTQPEYILKMKRQINYKTK